MTAEELRSLFSISGWGCKIAHGEVVLEVCYFCGNQKSNLECSTDKGVFHCWACKRGGRLSELIHLLTGQIHHIPVTTKRRGERPIAQQQTPTTFKSLPIAQVPSAAKYLSTRGIAPDVAAQYGMVVCTEAGHRLEGRLTVQLREYWSGDLAGWVGRSYTGRTPKYISTLEHRLITGWRTRDKSTPVVLVEGPFDGIAAHRAGYQVGVLSGMAGHGVIDWAARLDPSAPVALMLDQDAPDQQRQLYWQLQPILRERLVTVEYSEADQDPAKVGPAGVRSLVDDAIRRIGHTI